MILPVETFDIVVLANSNGTEPVAEGFMVQFKVDNDGKTVDVFP